MVYALHLVSYQLCFVAHRGSYKTIVGSTGEHHVILSSTMNPIDPCESSVQSLHKSSEQHIRGTHEPGKLRVHDLCRV